MSFFATMLPTPGILLGPYRVLAHLGEGGMGQVYLAEDTRLNRKIALKRLSGKWLAGPDSRKRLLREARAAARLNHPNIAAVYDVAEMNGEAYIVMEYVEGETLADRLRPGPLPVFQALEIAVQLADALIAAHAAGVVHCDLKPANVRLTSGGKAKVLDFGLARTVVLEGAADSLEGQMTEAGQLVGTPAYMSPERLLGKPVDRCCDIYSLGVVLFEMLMARRPFQGTDAIALGLAVLTEKAPAPSSINPAVPTAVSAIVERAMAGAQEERYQTADEMKAAVVAVMSGTGEQPTAAAALPARAPVAARTSGITDRVLGHVSSRRSIPLWFAVLAIVIVVGLRMSDRLPLREATVEAAVPVVAVFPLENLTGLPEDDGLCAGISEVLRSNLSKVRGLNVLSRGATLPSDGHQRDSRRLGRELGATFVIDGGLQRIGDQVNVTITLLRAGSDLVLWSDTYTGDRPGIFELQSRISEAVARQLPLSLTTNERRELARTPTANLQAFGEFAQGRAFLERSDVAENVDRAIRLFESAIERDPGFALAHAGLGEAYWARYLTTRDAAWPEKAIREIGEAVRLDPDQPLVKLSLARIYHGTGRNDEAIQELQRALQLNPDLDDVHRLLGTLLAASGQHDAALRAFQRAIELRPGYWRNHADSGLVQYRAGNLEQAEAAFSRVTELQPDSVRGFQMLGAVYQARGETQRALEQYTRANQIAPDPYAWSNIGTLHYWEGRYSDAAQAYEQAIALRSAEPDFHYNLGDAYRRLGMPDRARAAYLESIRLSEESLAINPKQPQVLSVMARCQAKLGNDRQALQRAMEAASLASADPEILYTQAVVHALGKREAEAIAALEQALSNGYSVFLARRDDALAPLRHLPDYRRLLEHGH
jgi:tetratricopeptide (TPR) repeat protein